MVGVYMSLLRVGEEEKEKNCIVSLQIVEKIGNNPWQILWTAGSKKTSDALIHGAERMEERKTRYVVASPLDLCEKYSYDSINKSTS